MRVTGTRVTKMGNLEVHVSVYVVCGLFHSTRLKGDVIAEQNERPLMMVVVDLLANR